MTNPTLYRKRLIPNECIELKDDVIIRQDESVIVTKWKTIHPRKDMDHGYSAYLLDLNVKVSKFCREDGSLVYWYCDIVDYEIDEKANSIVSLDLLLDVLVYPDESVRLLDMDELAQAHKEHLITEKQLYDALVRSNRLLNDIYDGKFRKYTYYIESLINN